MTSEEKLYHAFDSIKSRIPFKPKSALILGSGLGDFADTVTTECVIPYNEIDGFPVSTVDGHKGQYVFGYVGKMPVVIMQGRVHYYEGYSMTDVVLPVRLMKLMGAEILFLTNAAGGINMSFKAGDLMMITDQISMFVPSSLTGKNIDNLGQRFPDMSSIYDRQLCDIIRQSSEKLDIELQEGVYIQFTGPEYETPAEVRMARMLGADAVGMSTACEAVAANHMGMRICGISCISNPAAGMGSTPLNHKEVQAAADMVSGKFKALVRDAIESMDAL